MTDTDRSLPTPHQHNTDACDECDAIYTMGREDRSTLGTTPITLAPLDFVPLATQVAVTRWEIDVDRLARALVAWDAMGWAENGAATAAAIIAAHYAEDPS